MYITQQNICFLCTQSGSGTVKLYFNCLSINPASSGLDRKERKNGPTSNCKNKAPRRIFPQPNGLTVEVHV